MPPPPGTLNYRYRPLAALLAAVPSDQQSVRLTLADLHALLGSPIGRAPSDLPNWNLGQLARTFRRRAGFAATLDRRNRAITFTRQPLDSRPRQEA